MVDWRLSAERLFNRFAKRAEIFASCYSLGLFRSEVVGINLETHPTYIQSVCVPTGANCLAGRRLAIGMMLASFEQLIKLDVVETDRIPVRFGKFSASETMSGVNLFIFAHTIVEVGKMRNHLLVRSGESTQVQSVSFHGPPMLDPVNGAVEKG